MGANGSCSKCGRVNCLGSMCDQCPKTCWSTPDPIFGQTWLWDRSMNPIRETCNGAWQLLWPQNRVSATPAGLDLLLRVVLIFENKTLSMHFSSVVLVNNLLSVGESVDNLEEASWWEAPFHNRSISRDGNCKGFFYPTQNHCRANGLLTWSEQMELYNATRHWGYAWVTGDDEFDLTQISSIQLWMKATGND